MSKRYDVITGKKRDDKTYWTNIGSAWPSDKGGFSVELSALPIPDHEGRVRMLIVEPKPRDDAPRSGQVSESRRATAQAGPRVDLDDDIPF